MIRIVRLSLECQEIDGSGARAFEQSVVLLLNELPRRRREEFAMALALIWIGNTVDVPDGDPNEDAYLDDVRLLNEFAEDLLTEIKRGDVLSAIEKREEPGSDYTSVEYFEQLDGLQFNDVVSLAERFGKAPDLAAINREIWCRQPNVSLGTSRARHSWCDEFAARCPTGACIRRSAARAFIAAREALETQQYSDARAAIEKLDFARLSPYERSMAERLLAQIAYAEQDYERTRDHLLSAIYAGGLSAERESELRSQIDLLDAQLSAGPQPE